MNPLSAPPSETRPFEQRAFGKFRMKILDILLRDAILVDLKATGKREVLEEICAAVAAAEPAADRAKLVEVLSERERLQSTGIGEGVAIPHGKVPGLPRLVAAFAKSRGGGASFARRRAITIARPCWW